MRLKEKEGADYCLVNWNADGSAKRRPMVIGRTDNPQAFRAAKTGKICLLYTATTKRHGCYRASHHWQLPLSENCSIEIKSLRIAPGFPHLLSYLELWTESKSLYKVVSLAEIQVAPVAHSLDFLPSCRSRITGRGLLLLWWHCLLVAVFSFPAFMSILQNSTQNTPRNHLQPPLRSICC